MAVQPAETGQRGIWIKNTETEESIPGFGVSVIVPGLDVNSVIGTREELINNRTFIRGTNAPYYSGENVVFPVRKATTNDETIDRAMLVFNGPQPILPGQVGLGTKDYPVRAGVDFEQASNFAAFLTGNNYGVRAGSWFLSPLRVGFRSMGQDTVQSEQFDEDGRPLSQVGGGRYVGTGWSGVIDYDDGQHVLEPKKVYWVTKSDERPGADAAGFTQSAISSGAAIDFASNATDSLGGAGPANLAADGFGSGVPPVGLAFDITRGFRLRYPGTWLVTCQGLLTLTERNTDEEGATLKLVLRNKSLDKDTMFYAERTYTVDDSEGYGPIGAQTAEWVCFNAVLNVTDVDTQWEVVNKSQTAETIYFKGFITAVNMGGSQLSGIAYLDL